VLIENCYFNTGDDCIAIKSGRNNDGRKFGKPSQNIVIRKCTMVEGHGGVVIGSEISGNASYIFAEDCIMDSPNLDRAVRIKSNSLRGGLIEHIYVRNLEVKQVKEAVLRITMFYGSETGPNLPAVRNILLENIKSYKSKYGVWIDAYAEKPAENIVLKNCDFTNVKKENIIKNVHTIYFDDVYINNKKVH
jgi:polygalacturonase